jgi:hypothetical protein
MAESIQPPLPSFEDAILHAVHERINKRVRDEVRGAAEEIVGRIIAEEVASVAIQISRRVRIMTLGEKLTIEILKPGQEK